MSQALFTQTGSISESEAKRLAAIAQLCATRGAQYQGLKNYRSL